MEKDNMLRARLSPEQMQLVDRMVDEMQTDVPHGNISASSMARYAVEEYIDRYIAKKHGTKLFIELDVSRLTKADLAALMEYVSEMVEKVNASGNAALKDTLFDLDFAVTSLYAQSITPKREE